MQNRSTRRAILVNTLWGKANVLVRYVTSFAATAIIAAKYPPSEFGFYQLILTYLGIVESFNLLSVNHLKNHLVNNPEDEGVVAATWFYQSVALWAGTTLILIGCAFFMEDSLFWWLLGLGNIRILFRAYDYVQIIADYRLRNDMTQKIQMVIQSSFNVSRISAALLKVSMSALVSVQIVQGVVGWIFQVYQRRRLGFEMPLSFSWIKYKQLVQEGAWLSLVVFLSSIQARVVSAFAAERMSVEVFGNFQLVVKLVEPATAIGAIVFAANYTVLAHTLRVSRSAFIKRFFKIAALSISIAGLCGFVICIFPTSLLLKVFGQSYEEGLGQLWLGAGIIVANTILAVSVQFDMISIEYRKVILKYGTIFATYVVAFSTFQEVSLKTGLLIQCIVPLAVVLIFDSLRVIQNKY